MKALGINFTQNELRYAVLDNLSDPLTIVDKNKIVYPTIDIPSLMEWFETQLNLTIDKHHPETIGYKVSLILNTVKQIQQSCYPQAILNLIAKKRNIEIIQYTPQGINSTKFGQPKKTDVYKYLDSIIGVHPPYWDKSTKDAVLVAWFNIIR